MAGQAGAVVKVPLMRDTFIHEQATRSALADFLRQAPRLSMGSQCATFEATFAGWQGRRHAVLMNSGSSANLALIQALINLGRMKPGDKVGVSALTWATNVMPLVQLGLEPVALDVSPGTLNVLFTAVEQQMGVVQTVFLTNALGFTGPLSAIRACCERDGIVLLEDNCEALGTVLKTGRAGNFGLASTFSMFVGHHLSTIEGGIVCTDEDSLADALRMARAHGWDRNVSDGEREELRRFYHVGAFDAGYTFYAPGYNLRPTEITGFLGLAQLPLMHEAIKRRQAIYERLAEAQSVDFLRLDRKHITTLSAFAFPMVCKSKALRKNYLRRFADEGVEVRPLIAGNIQRQPFWSKAGLTVRPTPGADMLHEQGFYAPLRPDLSEEEIVTIERCIR